LTDFKNVSTSAARYQNLSLNPVKLSGQCGRLKCCLNYELETYMDALKGIPTIEGRLKTKKGDAVLQKTDIFKRMMWFGIVGEESVWIPVSCDRVQEIIDLNKKGIIPESFEDLNPDKPVAEKLSLSELNSDLERMDKKYGNTKNKGANKNGGRRDNRDNRPRGPKPDFQARSKPNAQGPATAGGQPTQAPRPAANPNSQNPNAGNASDSNADGTTPKPYKKKFKKKFKPRPPGNGPQTPPSA
jgi:hypothetical protein